MKSRAAIIALLLLGMAPVPAMAGQGGETCRTAREIIERNLDAIGGIERIRAVRTLSLTGGTGSALLPPSERATVYLLKPDRYKQVGTFRVVLCDGERFVYNDGKKLNDMTGGTLEGMYYRLGFYHNAFSLLKWEAHFDAAKLLGIKEYGEIRQYEILMPGAENGRDLLVYVDADNFLIDRLVFIISQEGAGTIQVVNQLRDWKEIDGITMPTRVVFDKIGWETTPTHFVIDEIQVNPEIDESIYDSAEIDFGEISVEQGAVRGEIFGDMDGSLLTNITLEDLAEAGIEVKSWLNLAVGETRMQVRFLDNIQRSAADIKPDEIYITTYPICGFPRMMLLSWNGDVTERIPCEKGDELFLSVIDGDEHEP